MAKTHDGISRYTKKLTKVGLVFAVIPEDGKPLTGASDSLKAWRSDEVMVDRNGLAALRPYRIDQEPMPDERDTGAAVSEIAWKCSVLVWEVGTPDLYYLVSLVRQSNCLRNKMSARDNLVLDFSVVKKQFAQKEKFVGFQVHGNKSMNLPAPGFAELNMNQCRSISAVPYNVAGIRSPTHKKRSPSKMGALYDANQAQMSRNRFQNQIQMHTKRNTLHSSSSSNKCGKLLEVIPLKGTVSSADVQQVLQSSRSRSIVSMNTNPLNQAMPIAVD